MSPFAEIKTFENKKTELKKIEFLDLSSASVVRILDSHPYRVESHFFMPKTSVECLGDECPVCDVNKKIYAGNPEGFRDDPNYHARSVRYFVNVLDRTMSRTCAKCSAEIKNLSVPSCPKCNEMIMSTPIKPLNRVKILGKGVQLFEQLNAIEASVLNQEGAPLGLTAYDITLVPSGSGKKLTITPIPDKSANDVVSVEEKFELTKAIMKLTREEMIDLQKGVSVKDIFTARKATKTDLPTLTTPDGKDFSAEARATVDALFASLEE